MQTPSNELSHVLGQHRVVPVVAGDFSAAACVSLAQALLDGGVKAMERPLRGNVHKILAGITRTRQLIPEMVIGTGTITDPELLRKAVEAGAQFGVSPGAPSPDLHEAIQEVGLPFIPGVLPRNELGGDQVADLETAQKLHEAGYGILKWFHAEKSGGPARLSDFADAIPGALWMPMGSIEERCVDDYLSVANVLCAGGSWVAPLPLIQEGRWEAISNLAKRAVRL